MSAKQQLASLDQRKRLLILEADLNRGLLEVQLASLRSRWGWLPGVRHTWPMSPRWLAAGGVTAIVLAARTWRTWARLLPLVPAGWRLFRLYRTSWTNGSRG